ncbi:MAG: UDP-glucose 4-epimerase GalE [Acidobacteria bacterium]|nr:UDP-glucose 4-epimerase GalE [Acidobacteriota bacterium]
MQVLVTGGAGYIGSFAVRALREAGHGVLVVDDLSRGHRESVPAGVRLVELSCHDTDAVAELMTRESVEAVLHFAALSLVPESVREPGLYWSHNVGGGARLLEACRRAGVGRFVFSSSAAVYGEPEHVPITEEHPLRPTNPYGATKRAFEEMLGHFAVSAGIASVALRYFNAAGAMPDGSLGEDHEPETHLVPLAIAAAAGRRPALTVFGEDYSTPDGTCLRDYVHVIDLARAHVLALDWMDANPGQGAVFNLGASRATSVREVIETVATVIGRDVPHLVGERREGDPAVLVASNERARAELRWIPERSDIMTIVRDAWSWHRAHPHGYAGPGSSAN